MTGLALCTLMLTPGAPVPVEPALAQAAGKIDPAQANQLAILVDNVILNARTIYLRDSVTEQDMLEAAIGGLYDAVGQSTPEEIRAAARKSTRQVERTQVLSEVRIRLGNHPNLAGTKSFFAAVNGLRKALDPLCLLSSPRTGSHVSIDQDFGIGLELDGASGMRWTAYHAEYGIASGLYAPQAYFGTPPKPNAVPSPAAFPWRVSRVVPGSPAQRAGLQPDDIITHLNGVEITADSVNSLFASFAFPRQTFDLTTDRRLPVDRKLTIRRGGEKPFAVTLKSRVYTPESAFGVLRADEGKWDCLLDRANKIGYIRLGALELGTEVKVAEMMADLTKQGCRGLILDLRWCPGGYIDPAKNIAGLFLNPNAVIAKLQFPNPRGGTSGDVTAIVAGPNYTRIPLVVLVGPETIGGGELIAAALRDHNRCVLLGQRTFGRATIQHTLETGFCQMSFRITVGISLRPSGKPRQREPESQPNDEWGVRPDDGLEVPVTLDKWAELRRQADLHGLRAAESRAALPFDDPNLDPHRFAALIHLRKRLGPVKE